MFSEPPNEAVITLKSILEGTKEVLYVVNDEEGWQFLSGEPVSPDDAMIVALKRVLDTDETLQQLGDLPAGAQAWRESKTAPWQRATL